MGGHRGELRTRRQQRCQVEDQLDAKLREHAFEQSSIEDRARDLTIDLRNDRRLEAVQIESHDSAIAAFGQAIDQSMTDLTAGSCDQYNWFAHSASRPDYSGADVVVLRIHDRRAVAADAPSALIHL